MPTVNRFGRGRTGPLVTVDARSNLGGHARMAAVTIELRENLVELFVPTLVP
jgi:hypothetical protein